MKPCSHLPLKTNHEQRRGPAVLAACLSLFFLASCHSTVEQSALIEPVRIGVIADVQYADRPNGGKRHYRTAPQKLDQAIKTLNDEKVELILHLGDFIDKDWDSFDVVLPIAANSEVEVVHLLGNHDFSVADEHKLKVPDKLGMPARYHRFDHKGWRFLILDGNELSFYAWPEGSENALRSAKVHARHFPDAPHWNGGMGPSQLEWLEQELELADSTSTPVILLNHFPIFPEDKHNLWNADEVLTLVSSYACVKAWFNGHNHDGHYGDYAGIHFVTFKGLVDTSETAFAIVELSQSSIDIDGVGREPDKKLRIKAN